MNRLQAAEQLRRALQMFSVGLSDEQAMEVVAVFDPWVERKVYDVGDYVTYGVNGVGDPQLYRCISAHTSQSDWTPDKAVSLFDAIGLDESGYPVWSQPAGAHDAYNAGDIVNHNGILYRSLIDGNTAIPGTDGRWWEEITV